MGPEPSSGLSPRAARSREKMLAAATDLLVESGPRSVTVDAVAEASGVAKSTLYRHWPSRTDLLVDVVRCSARQIEIPNPDMGFEPALRSLLQSAAQVFGDPGWVQIFPSVASLRTSIPELDSFFEADIAAKKQGLSRILDIGVAEGILPDSIEVEDAASLLIGPLAFAALTCSSGSLIDRNLPALADFVVDRFIASYRPTGDRSSPP